jgi:translation initiation factor 5B
VDEDFDLPTPAAGDNEAEPATKAPVEMTAEELADEEWGPVKEKGGKKKKGKGKDKKAAAEEPEDDSEF